MFADSWGGRQLESIEIAVTIKSAPITRAGLYDFQLIANHAHVHEGGVALLRVLPEWIMAKKREPKYGAAQAVEGQIIKIEFDFSSGIGDVPLDQWTRGPILPVGGEPRPASTGKRQAKSRKKRA